MNTDILLGADGHPEVISSGFHEVRHIIEMCENRFTRFSEQSELMRLNHSAGSWFQASLDLFDIVQQGVMYYEQTGGLFDPSILNALMNAGYDKSMDEIRVHGVSPRSQRKSDVGPGFGAVELDLGLHRIWLPEGMQIDLGGIAKGWVAEKGAKKLSAYSTACAVSAGGDMFMHGLPQGEAGWQVSLEDPRDPSNTLAILRIGSDCAIATSSVTKRKWEQGGIWRHHIIDPRTGEPAQTDWLSVTVIAPHATTAEVFAKTLLIAGSTGASAIQYQEDGIAFIAVDRNGRLWGSGNSKEFIDGTNSFNH